MEKKGSKLINAVKSEYKGHVFDSDTEKRFFMYLEENREKFDIEAIIVHPIFTILKPFKVTCYKCQGTGKVPSDKTGRLIKCRRCDGEGERSRQGTQYTPDFLVKHRDESIYYYDVKGFANERFPLIKKAFEFKTGLELIVVKWDSKKRKWIYK